MTTPSPEPVSSTSGPQAEVGKDAPGSRPAERRIALPIVLRLPRVGSDYSESGTLSPKNQNLLWGIGLSTGLVLAVVLNLPGVTKDKSDTGSRWHGGGAAAVAEDAPHKTADAPFAALRHEPLPTYRAPLPGAHDRTLTGGQQPDSSGAMAAQNARDPNPVGSQESALTSTGPTGRDPLHHEGSRQSQDLQTATRPVPGSREPGSAQFMNEVIINSSHPPDHERPRSSLY